MATTNTQMVEVLRGLLYDNGPEANGKVSGIAAHIVAEHDMFGDSLTHVSLTREELATVLAALAHYQAANQDLTFMRNPDIEMIATDGGSFDALMPLEVEALRERLNGGEG